LISSIAKRTKKTITNVTIAYRAS
jgi:hypothetical protein